MVVVVVCGGGKLIGEEMVFGWLVESGVVEVQLLSKMKARNVQ